MPKIAVIGAGYSGTLLSLHLLRRCSPSVQIALIERTARFGRGAAYSTGNPGHLLNVPAGRMSAFHDQPDDFVRWLASHAAGVVDPVQAEGSFVPRRVFGSYIRHLLNREIRKPQQRDRLELIRGDALDIAQTDDRLSIRLDQGRAIAADLAVLAVGNFPPEIPTTCDSWFYDTGLYRPDPWAPDAFSELETDSPVLLIGSGLTMVDAVISLLDQGHTGRITALSRRGLLPHRHLPAGAPQRRRDPLPTSLVELTHFLRREADRAAAEGRDWRAVVDELRPFTADLWTALSPADRARFLRHLRPWWEVHRHRMAGPVADRIHEAIEDGQLRVRAGKIARFEQTPDGVDITYRVRGTDDLATFAAARVVNCSGPSADYRRIAHPLIRNLLAAGAVRPDPLGLGLDVTPNCAVKTARGAITGQIFAVGPATKGAFWEMTAVPDIRRQCESVAGYLATFFRSVPAAAGKAAPFGDYGSEPAAASGLR